LIFQVPRAVAKTRARHHLRLAAKGAGQILRHIRFDIEKSKLAFLAVLVGGWRPPHRYDRGVGCHTLENLQVAEIDDGLDFRPRPKLAPQIFA
jgi:hypothetical protein